MVYEKAALNFKGGKLNEIKNKRWTEIYMKKTLLYVTSESNRNIPKQTNKPKNKKKKKTHIVKSYGTVLYRI